ncbi:hypothetical protein MP638_001930 [Amoeboaphelidium occidentale]|nr:hypothetical protein MP638_001930 [Amoeboaphelidium occidentale]
MAGAIEKASGLTIPASGKKKQTKISIEPNYGFYLKAILQNDFDTLKSLIFHGKSIVSSTSSASSPLAAAAAASSSSIKRNSKSYDLSSEDALQNISEYVRAQLRTLDYESSMSLLEHSLYKGNSRLFWFLYWLFRKLYGNDHDIEWRSTFDYIVTVGYRRLSSLKISPDLAEAVFEKKAICDVYGNVVKRSRDDSDDIFISDLANELKQLQFAPPQSDLFTEGLQFTKIDTKHRLFTWGSNTNSLLLQNEHVNFKNMPELVSLSTISASNKANPEHVNPVEILYGKYAVGLVTKNEITGSYCTYLTMSRNFNPASSGSTWKRTLAADGIIKVALGHFHAVFLAEDGEVYSFGWNKYGGLGLSSELNLRLAEVTRVTAISNALKKNEKSIMKPGEKRGSHTTDKVIGISSSKIACFCWTQKGLIFVWGVNNGQLGLPQASNNIQSSFNPRNFNAGADVDPATVEHLPKRISFVPPVGSRIVDIKTTETFSLILVAPTYEVYLINNFKFSKLYLPLTDFDKWQLRSNPEANVTQTCVAIAVSTRKAGVLTTRGDLFIISNNVSEITRVVSNARMFAISDFDSVGEILYIDFKSNLLFKKLSTGSVAKRLLSGVEFKSLSLSNGTYGMVVKEHSLLVPRPPNFSQERPVMISSSDNEHSLLVPRPPNFSQERPVMISSSDNVELILADGSLVCDKRLLIEKSQYFEGIFNTRKMMDNPSDSVVLTHISKDHMSFILESFNADFKYVTLYDFQLLLSLFFITDELLFDKLKSQIELNMLRILDIRENFWDLLSVYYVSGITRFDYKKVFLRFIAFNFAYLEDVLDLTSNVPSILNNEKVIKRKASFLDTMSIEDVVKSALGEHGSELDEFLHDLEKELKNIVGDIRSRISYDLDEESLPGKAHYKYNVSRNMKSPMLSPSPVLSPTLRASSRKNSISKSFRTENNDGLTLSPGPIPNKKQSMSDLMFTLDDDPLPSVPATIPFIRPPMMMSPRHAAKPISFKDLILQEQQQNQNNYHVSGVPSLMPSQSTPKGKKLSQKERKQASKPQPEPIAGPSNPWTTNMAKIKTPVKINQSSPRPISQDFSTSPAGSSYPRRSSYDSPWKSFSPPGPTSASQVMPSVSFNSPPRTSLGTTFAARLNASKQQQQRSQVQTQQQDQSDQLKQKLSFAEIQQQARQQKTNTEYIKKKSLIQIQIEEKAASEILNYYYEKSDPSTGVEYSARLVTRSTTAK